MGQGWEGREGGGGWGKGRGNHSQRLEGGGELGGEGSGERGGRAGCRVELQVGVERVFPVFW